MNAARALRKIRSTGAHEIAQRLARRFYQRLGADALDFPLLPGDIANSDLLLPSAPAPVLARRLRIAWLCTPPSAGSGGHTTLFRMVQAAEQAGHDCTLVLYDRHRGDLSRHRQVIARSWPWLNAAVDAVDDQLAGFDACVASSWPTAHVLARRRNAALHCFYFIQDFEPFFYPHGSEYELAADTYRFGFHHIALGHMVQQRLRSELSIGSDLVPFSVDRSVYRHVNRSRRSGVVFYAKPNVSRRGYLLGSLALAQFHERHPEQPIHVYGDPMPELGFPVVRHGNLTPTELNDLYNSTLAGLALSFTNISLVAEEMLAAGAIPVVNDSPDSRADLPNRHVVWSAPTPAALAQALCEAVENPRPDDRAALAAASVRQDNWSSAGQEAARIIAEAVGLNSPAQRASTAERAVP